MNQLFLFGDAKSIEKPRSLGAEVVASMDPSEYLRTVAGCCTAAPQSPPFQPDGHAGHDRAVVTSGYLD
eukprot:s2124_g3.t1